LCTVGFQGMGYSTDFVENLQSISDQLQGEDGDKVEIEVVEESDSICEPCPHRRGNACVTQSKINLLDQAHAKVLGIKVGDRITWGEVKERIRQRMSVSTHLEICQGCEWLEHQVCRQALQKLINES
jgi:hypothetical protein